MMDSLDKWHYHEALDRLFLVTQILGEFLEEHPVVKRHGDLRKLVRIAGKSLAEAYQIAGQLEEKYNGTKTR